MNISSENIDTEFDTSDTAVPMSADSSQLTATTAAISEYPHILWNCAMNSKNSEALASKTVSCKAFADELKSAFGYGGAMNRAAVSPNPDKYEGYRVDNTESGKRSMDDIAPQEIINAVTKVLREQISLSETDLIRETAKKFGYSRIGGVIENSVEYAVRTGISKGKIIKAENGNITLSE
ncbi:MAG: hypothetical protein NC395_01170 [Prevotella sp.]|nr:hypothetical protein [Prevotella sp.]